MMKKPNELTLTRLYDAPIKMVWLAFIDPNQKEHWWGPRGFTLTTKASDVQPGGTWEYMMHGPDGVDYPNITTYLEVEKYRRLVYDHGATETQPPLFRVSVDFTELGQQTQMDMTMAFATPERASTSKAFIKRAGGDATWDRLAEYLAEEQTGKERFFISRSFAAPIERVFDMWSNSKEVEKWLPPTGSEMSYIRSQISAGHSTFYVMKRTDGSEVYERSEYLEIVGPTRIVYTQAFCDRHEDITLAPSSPNWPQTTVNTVVLHEEGPSETRVTLDTSPVGRSTVEELEAFRAGKPGLTVSWTASFDQLESLIEG